MQDANDCKPAFSQQLYSTIVREDVAPGDTLLVIAAGDRDAGANAELRFASEDSRFGVDNDGRVFATQRLDADQHRDGHFIYRFNVTATDGGDNEAERRHTAVTTILVRTENVNDEPPLFLPTAEYSSEIADDAHSGTPLLQVQAVDADRDQIVYAFASAAGDDDEQHVGRSQHTTAFTIDGKMRDYASIDLLVYFALAYKIANAGRRVKQCGHVFFWREPIV